MHTVLLSCGDRGLCRALLLRDMGLFPGKYRALLQEMIQGSRASRCHGKASHFTATCPSVCWVGFAITTRTTHYNTLQHPATHCNTQQHTATHCNLPPSALGWTRNRLPGMSCRLAHPLLWEGGGGRECVSARARERERERVKTERERERGRGSEIDREKVCACMREREREEDKER